MAEKRKKVELVHPISHDGKLFSRGLHDLDEDLAGHFLNLKDPITREPIARVPVEKKVEAGKVEDDPAAKESLKGKK